MTTSNRPRLQRLAVLTTTAAWVAGLALLSPGPAKAIGGLCNGRPASHTWLDASGQYGPALLDGTNRDDDIIGSDGDDTIDARAGDDGGCGAAGEQPPPPRSRGGRPPGGARGGTPHRG